VSLARAVWGAVLALLLALAVLSKGWLEPGGLLIFDSRPWGYDLASAERYLAALGPEARALYLGPFRWLDTALPLLLTLGLVLMGRGTPKGWRLLAGLAALLYLWWDLVENARVAALLAPGVGLTEAAVAAASRATMAKWGCLAAAALLTAMARRAARRERKGRP